MKDCSDEQLVTLVIDSDDRAAFAELIERHKRGVFALLHRLVGSDIEIEDIAQNVFLAAYRGLMAFKKAAKFSTWLYRITYNQACSAIRKKRSGKEQMLVRPHDEEDNRLAEYSDPGAETQDQGVLKLQVWKAVENLPVQSKAVIEMYYGRGLNYPEIAEALALPIGTVKTHLYRARGKLRELLVEKPQLAETTK